MEADMASASDITQSEVNPLIKTRFAAFLKNLFSGGTVTSLLKRHQSNVCLFANHNIKSKL
jgi:hypothetical protein